MLDLGRYLLGVAEIALLAGFAWLGASRLRLWLLPRFVGAPAHLATAVLAIALLIWVAELLGSFGALEAVPYLLLVGVVATALWRFAPRPPEGGSPHPTQQVWVRTPSLWRDGREWRDLVPALIALLVAAIAVIRFAAEAKPHLSTGMTGFDSTWYHGPFAAGFFQSGDTWDLHFIAPQFLAWFYPANSEIFHAVGMLAFGRDILSPLLNLGWFVGCLMACWCIGRPYRVAPWSLALGAVALSVPALADQAGEARNDVVGIFFLLTAVAIALNASSEEARTGEGRAGEGLGDSARFTRERSLVRKDGLGGGSGAAGLGPWLVVGLAAGLATGTKLNFLLPAGVLIVGLAAIAPGGARGRALIAAGLAALAGGGYWYLRNLVHSGDPLPWIDHLGPIWLPAPDQALGGREAHSVLGYLTDGTVWSDWFLPGLHDGLWFLWPPLLLAALAGLVLCLLSGSRCAFSAYGTDNAHSERDPTGGRNPVLALAGLVGLATALVWLVAPTSASGPAGMPRGFESGLRYLAPALVLGLALLPTVPMLRDRLASLGVRTQLVPDSGTKYVRTPSGAGLWLTSGAVVVVLAVALGYPAQRHYLENRYTDPSFTTPGLNAAFAWSRDIGDSRIATASTRQYPLFGTDLSNHVQYIGEETPHGGFEALTTCRAWRKALNEGDYDYVVASRDRIEPGKPPYPPQARWTEGSAAKPILKTPPTAVFQLTGRLDPSACR